GNKITVKDIEANEILVLHLVGSKEVDMKAGKISDESPVGKAVIGHSKGDIVDVEAPSGVLQFEIIDISK
ncbi:MAG: GreA/GreB family elongation factor, partial [Ruminiclostridium sp.]